MTIPQQKYQRRWHCHGGSRFLMFQKVVNVKSSPSSHHDGLWGSRVKADSHIACCVHVIPLPCRAAKGLECVFPIWVTQCGSVWFTLAMPCPCRAHAMLWPSRSSQGHGTAQLSRRPVGYLPAFSFFWLPRRVPQRLLVEAYQSSSQRSIPTIVKSGNSTLQKRWSA